MVYSLFLMFVFISVIKFISTFWYRRKNFSEFFHFNCNKKRKHFCKAQADVCRKGEFCETCALWHGRFWLCLLLDYGLIRWCIWGKRFTGKMAGLNAEFIDFRLSETWNFVMRFDWMKLEFELICHTVLASKIICRTVPNSPFSTTLKYFL